MATGSRVGQDVLKALGVVEVWDAETTASVARFDAPRGTISAIALSRDGARVAVASWWSEGREVAIGSAGDSGLAGLGHAYTSISHAEVAAWDITTGTQLLAVQRVGVPGAVAFIADGSRLGVVVDGGLVVEGIGGELAAFPGTLAAIAEDGVSGLVAQDGKARVVSLTDLRDRSTFVVGKAVQHAYFAGGDVLLGDELGTLQRVYGSTGDSATTYTTAPSDMGYAIGASPDGSLVAAGDRDNTVTVWSSAVVSYGAVSLRGHAGALRDVAVSSDKTRVVTASDDGTARVWSASDGALVATLDHAAGVITARFLADATSVVTVDRDAHVQVWRVPVRHDYALTPDDHDDIDGYAFSPVALRLAIAGGETVRLVDPATDRVVRLVGHTAVTTAVAWSPDGTQLVTASGEKVERIRDGDRTARIWDATTGKQLARIDGLVGAGHSRGVGCARPARDLRDRERLRRRGPDDAAAHELRRGVRGGRPVRANASSPAAKQLTLAVVSGGAVVPLGELARDATARFAFVRPTQAASSSRPPTPHASWMPPPAVRS